MVVGLRDPRVAGRVEAPLEDVALDHECARDLTLENPLCVGPDVDEKCALLLVGVSRRRGRSSQAAARCGQQEVDARNGLHQLGCHGTTDSSVAAVTTVLVALSPSRSRS